MTSRTPMLNHDYTMNCLSESLYPRSKEQPEKASEPDFQSPFSKIQMEIKDTKQLSGKPDLYKLNSVYEQLLKSIKNLDKSYRHSNITSSREPTNLFSKSGVGTFGVTLEILSL